MVDECGIKPAFIKDVASPVANDTGANGGLFADFDSVLVRPDGYLAHVLRTSDARGAARAVA